MVQDTSKPQFSSLITDALRMKSMNAEKLAAMTGISDRFISLLLDEKFEELPAAPYVRGYLMKIAEVLNLDGTFLWEEYVRNKETLRRPGKYDVLPTNRFAVKVINKKLVLGVAAALLIALYVLLRLPSILGKPQFVSLSLPEDNARFSTSELTVRGTLSSNDQLTVNREVVYPNERGEFEKIIPLEPGFNTIELKLRNFLGKETVVERKVFYEATSTPHSNGTN